MEWSKNRLDANVFVHAQSTDERSEKCRAFLSALEEGRITARLEIVVLHERTYVLPCYLKQMGRFEVAQYLVSVVEWPGVDSDANLFLDTLDRWGSTPGLGFVDAYLAALASIRGCPVYTMNARELRAQGAIVPDPLYAP